MPAAVLTNGRAGGNDPRCISLNRNNPRTRPARDGLCEGKVSRQMVMPILAPGLASAALQHNGIIGQKIEGRRAVPSLEGMVELRHGGQDRERIGAGLSLAGGGTHDHGNGEETMQAASGHTQLRCCEEQ
jgi:hypothetical protein